MPVKRSDRGGEFVDGTLFRSACESIGLACDGGQIEMLDAFETALYAANETSNLTRIWRDECWLRHFVDSLLFHDLIPVGSTVLDIGTGPGFPAFPLACMRPDLAVVALDSSSKMLGFLRSQPLANLTVVQMRAEQANLPKRFEVVTGRAVAPLSIQFELSADHCELKGAFIPMRTPSDLDEINRLTKNPFGFVLETTVERQLPHTEIVRLFPVFRKVSKTPLRYPRTWAEMRRASV